MTPRMPARLVRFMVVLALLFSNGMPLWAQDLASGEDNAIVSAHTDFLYFQDRRFFQDIYLETAKESKATISISGYRFRNETDSVRMYRHTSVQQLKKGMVKIILPFQEATGEYYLLPSFAAVIRKTGLIPPGSYSVLLRVQVGNQVYERRFLNEQDSLLPALSPLRKDINDLLDPSAGQIFPGSRAVSPALDKVSRVMERSQIKLQRYCKKKGLHMQQRLAEGKEIIDLYADEWFVGRYAMEGKASVQEELRKHQSGLQDNLAGFTSNNLGDYPSLLSQFRELKKNSQENKDLTGEFALSANFSNDQEPNSQQDNNFYEARGMLEFPLFDIPVSVSGYYITQDKHREAKASYVHFRYDADKAKEQLLKLVGSYNRHYEQTIAQGATYDMVYGQAVQQLQAQKDQAIAGLKRQAGIGDLDMASLNEEQLKTAVLRKAEAEKDKLKNKLEDSLRRTVLHSEAAGDLNRKAGQLQENKQKAEDAYAKALEQYQKIKALEQKIKKYQALLDQYRNTLHYDSALAYSKLKDLKNMDESSYRDLAKRASGILPESNTKSLLTGLTSFDAGMFPKYVSDYTMSGQMLKGVDIGYDIGFATVGGSYGKTEYIDRNGDVEGYKAYGGRVQLKPILDQKIGFVYFGYSPGRKLLSDNNFFKDASISLPSFRNPVHIISATRCILFPQPIAVKYPGTWI